MQKPSKEFQITVDIVAGIFLFFSLIWMWLDFGFLHLISYFRYLPIPPMPELLFMALFLISLPLLFRDLVKRRDLSVFSSYLLGMASFVYLIEILSFHFPHQQNFTWGFAVNSGILPLFALVVFFAGAAALKERKYLRPNTKITLREIFFTYLHPSVSEGLRDKLAISFPVLFLILIAFPLLALNSMQKLGGSVDSSFMLTFWLATLMDVIFVYLLVKLYIDGGLHHAICFTGGVAGVIIYFIRNPLTEMSFSEAAWLLPFVFVGVWALGEMFIVWRKNISAKEPDKKEWLTFK